MLIDSRSEINGFKTDPWGLLEALWGPLEALRSIYMEPRAHFGIQFHRNQCFWGSPWPSGSIVEYSPRLQNLFLQTPAAKSMGSRDRGWLQECPKRDFGKQLQRNQCFFRGPSAAYAVSYIQFPL